MIDELTLKVGNKLVQGWDDIRVTRGIERLPSDFDLSLMDYYPGSDGEELVRKGDPCQVMLGDDLVMTGYIDRWNPALSKSRHEIRATGRSKCQDLVDCSAEWPNNVISQANALQIAQRLAAPYGINVSSDVEDMATVPQFTLNWGESSQEVIDRISRWAALLYFDTPDGNLLLTRVGTRKAASGVAQGENIEYASFTDSMDERFSDYIGVSMTTTPVAEFSPNAGYDAVTLARARDPEAAKMRYRNRVIIVESTMIANQQAQNCIDWEMNRRFGRSRQLQVTVDSWRDKSGKLWEPNTLIPISLPKFGLKDELWLLAEVTFLRGEQGTTARMVLMPPAAFAVQPYAFYRQLLEVN
ncbi:Mu-like prophage tail protein gpP [Serratia fonticola]|uniref:phage baseplate assembly protein n=1 Tax=Serratia fonticola TaxID=47917 RepID=UPI0019FD124B|nr:contractile injection system protein, VgrG/Pvc8 family [Serratia fonticola]MBE0150940.1 phage tail protein [Serratia fonticola]CAI1698669.1 Mu-like prophage tail protein gpP [Serratia fonticola]